MSTANVRANLPLKPLSGEVEVEVEVEVPAAEAVVEGRQVGSEVSGYEQPALF